VSEYDGEASINRRPWPTGKEIVPIIEHSHFLSHKFYQRVSKMLGQTSGVNFPHQNKGKISYP
jgi:hypothetical protein